MKKAYRGYLICKTLTGEFFIEADKTLICWARNEADACRKIDSWKDGGITPPCSLKILTATTNRE